MTISASEDFSALANAMAGARGSVATLLESTLAGDQGRLADAMRHALHGGKGLRGFLVFEGAKLHGLAPEDACHAAAAVEVMHAYSLVHDDLPAMDDDDLRRGRPTVHRHWDEATAILCGDALQSLSFGLLAECDNVAMMVATMAQAAGHHGMAGGQMLDMEAASTAQILTGDALARMQALKTGALFAWSAAAGARLAGADAAPFVAYGNLLGQVFQIADDMHDVVGDAEVPGKPVAKDARAGKATHVARLGLEGARHHASLLVNQACAHVEPFGATAGLFMSAARFALARTD